VIPNLKCEVRLSHWSGGGEPSEGTDILLTDEASGVQFAQVRLTTEEFGQLMRGRGAADCPTEVRGLDLLGKRRESKSEVVEFAIDRLKSDWQGGNHSLTAPAKKYAKGVLAPFEVDGWEARMSDLTNHHRRVGQNGVEVTFVRYVDAK
jgi:hypothetical protein